ncbi:uncharacterized PPE family protein PPE69 isoform X1 [Drosophila albomicans]|uniref:Uncharacterized PPE family protein PPE69 isoform X1 n=1 Tax=Drosophila albomicans TaxID=7291 RepID=A0A9C6W840_DROAB|nr:uncharacterized PPE family protein PPE69 isoform X1 [Drosophila albomicans]
MLKRAFTIGANRAARISNNKWNMLMLPLLEYNKHIAKIPNCKMRSSPLRLSMLHLLLLLWMLLGAAATSSSSNSNGNSNGPSAAAGAAGGASAASGAGGGGGGGAAAAGPGLPPGALNANLTDLGSPGKNFLFSSSQPAAHYKLMSS